MKIDRILEIIIYLLNHDNVPASFLARKFHVSVRTIQRDMITISSIGIPVYADFGKNGGYSILPNYKINNIDIRKEEQHLILKALESLSTSYSNDCLNTLIEKYKAITKKEETPKVFLDFSASKENQHVQELNTILEDVINKNNYIKFDYIDSDGNLFHPIVQPLAIHYKWHAWYLLAFEEKYQCYRTFKIARIANLEVMSKTYTHDHGDIKERIKEAEQAHYETCVLIEAQFQKEEIGLIREYFPDASIESIDHEKSKIIIEVPRKERIWKALFLSFGSNLKIISPNDYRDELIQLAKKFYFNYDK